MGYCIQQRDSNFRIKAENKGKALKAIKDLSKVVNQVGGGASYKGGKLEERCFSWVDTSEFVKAETLKEAIQAWRWDVYSYKGEEDNDIDIIEFTGEKMGDDEILFKAIAPFVEDGSFIEMQGEDGALWRWVFEKGKFREVEATISWE